MMRCNQIAGRQCLQVNETAALQTYTVVVITLIILTTGFLALLLGRMLAMRRLLSFTIIDQIGIGY